MTFFHEQQIIGWKADAGKECESAGGTCHEY